MEIIVNKLKIKFFRFRSTSKLVSASLRIVIIAMYTALVYALQLALAFIPNVELVTFLISMAALIFTWYYAIGIAIAFCCLEMILGGLGVWELTYFLVWPGLVLITTALKGSVKKHWWIFIIINALFGLLFGSFDTAMNVLVYGTKTALVYWVNGWIFDGIHCVSNFIIAFILFKPIYSLFQKTLKKYLF